MSAIVNLAGKHFGNLVAIELNGSTSYGRAIWLCLCDCGKNTSVLGSNLRRGKTKSCGCTRMLSIARAVTKHGKIGTREYRSWASMCNRCFNPNQSGYENWGGRGITVCDRWRGEHGFEYFLADMGPRSEGTSLDRFPDDNGNYEPGNVRWANAHQQRINQRRMK